jgi:hypothetical protein
MAATFLLASSLLSPTTTALNLGGGGKMKDDLVKLMGREPSTTRLRLHRAANLRNNATRKITIATAAAAAAAAAAAGGGFKLAIEKIMPED